MARGEIVQPTKQGIVKPCTFCAPDPADYPHFKQYGRERIDLAHLLETPNVYMKPDILPSSPDGHLLVIPKPHSTSFASLPALQTEVGQIIYQAEQILGRPVVFFEHGSTQEGHKIQSVYHQHGHLIPDGSTNVLDYMRDYLNRMGVEHQIIDTPDLSPIGNLRRVFDGRDYIYIQQGRVGLIAHAQVDDDGKQVDFPSQISQRAASRLFSNRELNWKEIRTNEEMARTSVASIAHIVDNCGFPIPGQIGRLQGIKTG